MDIKQKDMYIRSLIVFFLGVLAFIFYFLSYDIGPILVGLILIICGTIFLILAHARKFPNKLSASFLAIISFIIIFFFLGTSSFIIFALIPSILSIHPSFFLFMGISSWAFGGYGVWLYFNKEEI